MTEPVQKLPDYPTGIVTKPFVLDGVSFSPFGPHGNMERAERDHAHVGDVLLDKGTDWKVRKRDARGELSDWKPMRCVAEARAFIVSRVRQQ